MVPFTPQYKWEKKSIWFCRLCWILDFEFFFPQFVANGGKSFGNAADDIHIHSISSVDSRTYPGPLIVVEISRHPEVIHHFVNKLFWWGYPWRWLHLFHFFSALQDGLSIVVSPMTRIHNESGLTMELRFRRNQPKEDECASVLVEPKDVIDDSMGMFDALNSSGGLRKALMSLSVGTWYP